MLKTVTYNETLNASVGTTPFFIAEQAYTVLGISWGCEKRMHRDGHEDGDERHRHRSPGSRHVAPDRNVRHYDHRQYRSEWNAYHDHRGADDGGGRPACNSFRWHADLSGGCRRHCSTPAHNGLGDRAGILAGRMAMIATQSFFQANRDMVVTGVKAVYGTAFGAAITINVMKDTSTTAAGGGTSVLAAAMAGDGAINTVASLGFDGHRFCKLSMEGYRRFCRSNSQRRPLEPCLRVTVTFQPIYARKARTFHLAAAPNAQQQVAQCFFIADRAYEVVDASCIFDVAATGGAAKIGVTIDKGTTVPGGGNVVQTRQYQNAGFDLNAAARTSQFMTPASLHLRLLSPRRPSRARGHRRRAVDP